MQEMGLGGGPGTRCDTLWVSASSLEHGASA